jgi:hypothetical protein
MPPDFFDREMGVWPVALGVDPVRPRSGRIMGTEARITARQGSIPEKMFAFGIVYVMSAKSIVDRTEMRRAEITHVLFIGISIAYP